MYITQNCYESTFGICRKCNYGIYLNKPTQKCLKQEWVFEHCRESLDGKTYDEENICCRTN